MIIDVIFLAFTYWNALETALSKLRSKGVVGMFLVDLITSPAIQVTLILVSVSLFAWAVIEMRRAHSTKLPVTVPSAL